MDGDRLELRSRTSGTPPGLELVAPIGSGGQGTIWRARLGGATQTVALKVIRAERAATPLARAAFLREVRAVAAMQHPHVVPIHDHGVLEGALGPLPAGSPWLMMPMMEDGSLASRLDGSLRPADVRGLFLEILAALAHAHARGIVHRDLKPANLLAGSPAGSPWQLTDFGIAYGRHARAPLRDDMPSAGTPRYMAPEQIRGELGNLGPWTDLYALGCLALEVLAGAPPFDGEDVAAIFRHQLYSEPPVLVGDPGLAAWLARLLDKSPRARFQAAADAAAALRDLPLSAFPSGGAAQLGRAAATAVTATSTLDAIPADLGPRVARPTREAPPAAPLPETLPPSPAVGPPPPGTGRGLHGLRDIPFVGRDAELGSLWARLRAAAAERRVRCVVIRGPSGRGKSRLARALAEAAHAHGGATQFTARFSVDEAASPLRARFPSGPAPGSDPVEVAEALARATRGGRVGVVILDDAHLSSEAIALARALSSVRDLPVLVLLTVTDEGLAERPLMKAAVAALESLDTVQSLPLAPLPEAQWCGLVETLMGFSGPLASRLARATAGDPTLALQLIDGWLADDALVVHGDGLALADEARWEVPGTAAWSRRVVRALGRPPSEALALAAVLGLVVDPDEWARAWALRGQVTGEPGTRLEAAWEEVEALAVAGLAEIRDRRAGWSFSHARVREAILHSTTSDLADLHATCAAAVADGEDLGALTRHARHLVAAGKLAESLDPLARCTRKVHRQGWKAEGAELLDLWSGVLSELGVPASDPRWAAARLEELRQVLTRWSRAHGRALGEALIVDCERHGWDPPLSEVLFLTSLYTEKGSAASWDLLSRAVACAPADDGDWLARLLTRQGHLLTAEGRRDEGRVLIARALTHARDAETRALVSNYLARTLVEQGDVTTARTIARDAVALYRASGHRAGLASCLNLLGRIERQRGDVDGAERHHREAHALYRLTDPAGVLYTRICLARIALVRGEIDAALEAFEEVRCDPWTERAPVFREYARLGRLSCLAWRGDRVAYDADFDWLVERLGDGMGLDIAEFFELAGDGAAAHGDGARARAAWSTALEGVERLGHPARIAALRAKLLGLTAGEE